MLAIPVDTAKPVIKSSLKFGNAPFFAIYSPEEEQFFVIKNAGEGNGANTAQFLIDQEITEVAYTHMGDGLFKQLHDNAISCFFIGKKPETLFSIVESLKEGSFAKVTPENASELLDPGNSAGTCGCSCANG